MQPPNLTEPVERAVAPARCQDRLQPCRDRSCHCEGQHFDRDIPVVLARWLAGTGIWQRAGRRLSIYKKYGPPTRNPRPASRPVPSLYRKYPRHRYIRLHIPPVLTNSRAACSAAAFSVCQAAAVRRLLLQAFSSRRPLPVAEMGREDQPVLRRDFDAEPGVEFGLRHRWTLDISGNYNPWTFSGNRKMKHWLVQARGSLVELHPFFGALRGPPCPTAAVTTGRDAAVGDPAWGE